MRELSLHILDIAENSIRAGAKQITIDVFIDEESDRLSLTIQNDGIGMTPEMAGRVADPFVTSRPERKVGLGLPLLAAACERTGGHLSIAGASSHGTTVRAALGLSSIDRAPMGSLVDTVATLAATNPERRIVLTVRSTGDEFHFDSEAVRSALDGVPISNPKVVEWMRGHLEKGIGQTALAKTD